ncbi:MAG: septum formation initiator family protein [Clostridia bacterium]|nr:septum formation initiator family protein [Clostridia bacterium]
MQSKSVHRARRTRKSKHKVNWLLAVLVVGITLYVSFMIVDQHIKINNAKSELAQLDEKIFTQKQTNAELKKVADAVENNDEKAFAGYVEKIAREELDYVKNGEVVFVNIAGD